MIRALLASCPAGRPLAAALAAGLALCANVPAQADTELPASAYAVRNALIALTAADAAITLASVATSESPAPMPMPSLALKPETANAMAGVRPASIRRPASVAYLERRVTYRPYRDPFFLATGVAY